MESQDRRQTTSKDIARLLYDRCCSPDRHLRNAAFQQLGEYLLRIAYSRLRTGADVADLAQDCTQQSLVIIWQKLSRQSGPQHPEYFMSWAAGILIHKLFDELRKHGRRRIEPLPAVLEGAPAEFAGSGDDLNETYSGAIAPAAEQFAINIELRRELLRLIQEHPRLSPDAKAVLVGGYLQEQNDGELAAQLSKETGAIRVIRSRGLKILREDHRFMAEIQALAIA